jgi:predicted nucleic acid-binding protein
MILVDSSVWINHLRWGDKQLQALLYEEKVKTHPFVIGEICSGQLHNRKILMELLNALPTVSIAEHQETLLLLESKRLFGKGLGWIDIHLLASAIISDVPLWTYDKRLAEISSKLGKAAVVK